MICSAGDLLLAISGQRTGLWSFIRGILLLDSSEVCGEIIRDVFLVNTGPRLYLPTCASKLACKLLQAKANAPLIIVHPSRNVPLNSQRPSLIYGWTKPAAGGNSIIGRRQ